MNIPQKNYYKVGIMLFLSDKGWFITKCNKFKWKIYYYYTETFPGLDWAQWVWTKAPRETNPVSRKFAKYEKLRSEEKRERRKDDKMTRLVTGGIHERWES